MSNEEETVIKEKNTVLLSPDDWQSNDGSSPNLSRDSSTETYTDFTGTDLVQFLVDTLQNQKDRMFLLKIERDLTDLVKDNDRQQHKFTPMSSYNRMLVHRVAAFFGMEHNVDNIGNSVIVNKTKSTRLPDFKFRDQFKDGIIDEPKKSILKRNSSSLEEVSKEVVINPNEKKKDKRGSNNSSSIDSRRSKSFEEREEQYEKARARIFNQDSSSSEGNETNNQDNASSNSTAPASTHATNSSPRSSQEDLKQNWPPDSRPWSSTDSDSSARPRYLKLQRQNRVASSFDSDTTRTSITASSSISSSSGMFLTPDSCVTDKQCDPSNTRSSFTKASSFGGVSVLNRENTVKGPGSEPRLTKTGSLNVPTSSDNNNHNNCLTNRFNVQDVRYFAKKMPNMTGGLTSQPPNVSTGSISNDMQNMHTWPKKQNKSLNNSNGTLGYNQYNQYNQKNHQAPYNNKSHWQSNDAANSQSLNERTKNYTDKDKSHYGPQLIITPVGGYVQPHINPRAPNVNQVPQVSGPFLHYPYPRNQPPPNMKGVNSNSEGNQRTQSSKNRHLDSQMSALTINQPVLIGNDSSGNVCNKGNNEGWVSNVNGDLNIGDVKYRTGFQISGVRANVIGAQNSVLPMNPVSVSSASTVPLCHIHPSLPQPNTGSPPCIAPYPIGVQPDINLMFQQSGAKSNLVVLGSPLGNTTNLCSFPAVWMQQSPLQAIPQLQSGPVGNQSQVARICEANMPPTGVNNPPPIAPNQYPFLNPLSMPPNASQVGARTPFAFGPQMPVAPTLPMYVNATGANFTPNQITGPRPPAPPPPSILPTAYPPQTHMYRPVPLFFLFNLQNKRSN